MTDRQSAFQTLRDLLTTQNLAVLATDMEGQPYTSLVGFWAAPDLEHILFATARATRKYRNLVANPSVSLLIDNRRNLEADFHEAAAVTVLGTVDEVPKNEKQEFLSRYVEKHPALFTFLHSPTCALLRVRVKTYYLVSRFQNVVELRMEE